MCGYFARANTLLLSNWVAWTPAVIPTKIYNTYRQQCRHKLLPKVAEFLLKQFEWVINKACECRWNAINACRCRCLLLCLCMWRVCMNKCSASILIESCQGQWNSLSYRFNFKMGCLFRFYQTFDPVQMKYIDNDGILSIRKKNREKDPFRTGKRVQCFTFFLLFSAVFSTILYVLFLLNNSLSVVGFLLWEKERKKLMEVGKGRKQASKKNQALP